MVKSKQSPLSGAVTLIQLNHIHKKGHKVFFNNYERPDKCSKNKEIPRCASHEEMQFFESKKKAEKRKKMFSLQLFGTCATLSKHFQKLMSASLVIINTS